MAQISSESGKVCKDFNEGKCTFGSHCCHAHVVVDSSWDWKYGRVQQREHLVSSGRVDTIDITVDD